MNNSLKLAITSLAFASLASFQADAFALNLPTGYTVTAISLQTNDLVYNATSSEYLASIPSVAGYGLGNTITRLSNTGQLLSSTFVGSEPGQIALSSDGSTGYVALGGAPAVRQFDGVTGSAGQQISLGNNSFGSNYAEDIAVAPGQSGTLAVALRNTCCSPRHEGVAIYQNGVKLSNQTPGHTGSNTIEFGADANTLYGYNNETSDFGFRTMAVDGTGVKTVSSVNGGLYGYGLAITYDHGTIFGSRGEVINPANGQLLGVVNVPYGSLFLSAAQWGQAYTLSGAGDLTVVDLATFTPVTTFHLGSQLSASNFNELVLGGDGSLAARGGSSVVFLTAVPEPASALMWGLGLMGIAGARVVKRRTQA